MMNIQRPRGPILGARAEEAPTSPPVALRWLQAIASVPRSNHVRWDLEALKVGCNVHHLDLIGIEFWSYVKAKCQCE